MSKCKEKNRKRNSVQELLGIQHFTDYGLMTDAGELVFFRVAPTNISVLSPVNIAHKITGLTALLKLEPDNQFYTKYFLERVDKTTNYLIYAPFEKPALCDNHLADTIRYSKEFFADRVSLICVDLGIPENLKAILQKHAGFFKDQRRTDRFYKLEIDRWTQEAIEVGLMSVLCRVQALNFEEVVRIVLTGDGFEDNKYLADFKRHGLEESFWNLVSLHFGYTDAEPTLEKLVMTLLMTYAQKEVGKDLPKDWNSLISFKTGNVVVFMENIMISAVVIRMRVRITSISWLEIKTLSVSTSAVQR